VSALVLDRYDAAAVERFFDEAGVAAVIARRGFREPHVSVDGGATAPPCLQLRASKDGREHLLFEVRLTRITIPREAFPAGGPRPASPISLAEIFWARQQDPTATFSASRPRLPLQDHPGLGILRNVFRAGVRMASDLGLDGIGNMPKFPHDAVIFQRTLGFAFLDPHEQGRFEALWRDVGGLGLRDFSLAIIAGGVRDAARRTVAWTPGVQAFPLSAALSAYLGSDAYARARREAAAARYVADAGALRAALDTFSGSLHA
jgi:hypothetical protein